MKPIRQLSRLRRRRLRAGFSLVEVIIAMAVISLSSLATITMLTFARLHNDMEMERARAYQIISEEIEVNRFQLYPRIRSAEKRTVWDNGTPNDPTDDTDGTLTVTVRDAYTGAIITEKPNPAILVSVEVVMEWSPRGRRHTIDGLPPAQDGSNLRRFREVAMTYIAPN